jgi:predicted RNA-binding protein with PIN domain
MRLIWLRAMLLAMQFFLPESFAPTPRSSTWPPPYYRSCLQMGKGDGKQKRKKQSPSPAASPPPVTSANAPLRVSNDINIPVKRQIQLAKINQEFVKSQSSFTQTNPKKKTSYRKRLDEEKQQQVINDRRHRNAEVDWDVILSNGNGASAGALMLVDGYNVIYQWPRLKKQMLLGNTQRARELLVRDLEELHSIKGWRIECVFDGFGRNVNGPLGDNPGGERVSLLDREFKRQDTGRGVRIVYSGVGASADSYIEKRCLDAKSITHGKLSVSGGSFIVASNDAMIRLVATGAGALVMSSDRLVDELKAVKKVTEYRVEAAVAMVNRENRREELRNNRINLPVMQGAKGFGSRSVGLSEVDGKQVINTFRGGQFIIEDKRKKKNKNDAEDAEPQRNVVFGDLVQGTADIPSSAVQPNATKLYDNR